MNKIYKLLQTIHQLKMQLATGKSNPYPLFNLIKSKEKEVCKYLGIPASSSYQQINDRIKQIQFQEQ